jgi:hypothetical protein
MRKINTMSPKSGLSLLSGRQICDDIPLTWANSSAANTQKTATVASLVDPMSEYAVTVHNPSAVSDLTCVVYNVIPSLGGADRDAELTTLTFSKGKTVTKLVHGMFMGGNVKLVLSNDTVLGAADGFIATIRLIEV